MTTVVVGTATIAAITGWVGLGGIKAFVNDATADAQAYFESYFNRTPTSTDPEWDAFRHAFVSGAVTLAANADVAHFLGDFYEAYTYPLNTADERNMDYWNNSVGRTLGEFAVDREELALLVYDAIGSDITINDPEDIRTYSDGNVRLHRDIIPVLRDVDPEDFIPGEDYFGFPVAPTFGPWLNNLPSSPDPEHTLPGFVDDALIPWNLAPTVASPLVLDLDGDGVELTTYGAGSTETFFDIDGDGFAEQTAWVGADDGFLVRDLDESGTIDSVAELFGSPNVDGFALLATFDDNGDHLINQYDDVWSDLLVWKDADQDAVTDSGELHTLASLNIVSFDLAGVTASSSTISGNPISHTSTYTMTGGTTRAVADAWFVHSNVNSTYVEDYTLDVGTLFLPTLRGFGELPDLHIAMSQNEDLLELVQDFVAAWEVGRFEDGGALDSEVQEILWTWAGVEEVTTWGRGGNINGRDLAFLEKFFGDEFRHWGVNPNPTEQAAIPLVESWDILLSAFKAQLIVQAGGSDLFDDTISYNAYAGDFEGDMDLSSDYVDLLEAEAPAPGASLVAYWQQIAFLLDATKGLSNLTYTENTMLNAAIVATDNTLSWDAIKSDLDPGTGSTLYGTSGNDTLNGTSAHDTITTYAGNDTINAGAGNDQLYGGDGSDTIYGESGNDNINGEGDADTLYGGDGNDAVNGSSGNDIIYGGNGDDVLSGSSGADTIYGEAGADEIYGGDGDDILRPGAGGNLVEGGTGNDIYEYTSGHDYYDEMSGGGSDKIVLPSGITVGDLVFSQRNLYSHYGSLVIEVGSLGSIETRLFLYGNLLSGRIETIEFSDTSTLNWSSITEMTTYGSDAGDNIHGLYLSAHLDDTLFGLQGNDYLYGYGGNDILNGGDGNDVMSGGNGNDTYVMSAGFDDISDSGGSDTILIPDGYDVTDLVLIRKSSAPGVLEIHVDGLGQITISDQFNASTAVEMISFNGVSSLTLSAVSIETVGTSGNDSLDGITTGGSTNDILDGRAGDDTLSGGIGNDTYYFSLGTDIINEQGGSDTIKFHEGWLPEDVIIYRAVNWELVIQDQNGSKIKNGSHFSTSGYDYADYSVEEVVFADSTTWTLSSMEIETRGTSGNDFINGTTAGDASSADTIFAYAGNDTILADAGNDYINGGDGNDYMDGGAGDDVFVAGVGMDTVSESEGGADILHIAGGLTINEVSLSNVSSYDAKLVINASVDEVYLYMLRWTNPDYAIEDVRFDDGFITSLPDYSSWIKGTSGNDVAAGNGSDNTIIGYAGNDTITGGGGNDDAHGGSGNDSLDGGDGTDLLYGGTGDDILYGKAGLDTLHGGDGEDTFVFETASAFSNVDVIRDFDVSDGDILDLTDILDAAYNPLSDAIVDFVSFSESSGSTFVSVDRDGTGGVYSMAQIAKLEGLTGLASPGTLETNGNLIAA